MFDYVFSFLSACPADCIMVGDKSSDILAAFESGINRPYLIDSCKYPREYSKVKMSTKDLPPNLFLISTMSDINL